jgi:hypothetical protein
MFKDFTWQAFLMGLIASVVGFASSFAVVVGGLIAVGASPEQASSGLMAGAIAMGVAGIVLGMMTKMPITAAWSTPGAALMVTTGAVRWWVRSRCWCFSRNRCADHFGWILEAIGTLGGDDTNRDCQRDAGGCLDGLVFGTRESSSNGPGSRLARHIGLGDCCETKAIVGRASCGVGRRDCGYHAR